MKRSKTGRKASKLTRKQLSKELEEKTQISLTTLNEICPTQEDQKDFFRLVDIVNQAADDNEAKAKIIGSIGDISGAVVKIARKFVLKV